ncbi:hypothetical protein ACJ41I_04600, partial [Bifidobacterium catenulatum]|uniref:hypothetical protein n=1 Tax=Bifidobacterium catenulatum TaxID=1686 RepID=UPI003D34D0BE
GKRWKHNDSSACRKRPPNGRTASPEHENNDHMNQKQTPNGVSPPQHRIHNRLISQPAMYWPKKIPDKTER